MVCAPLAASVAPAHAATNDPDRDGLTTYQEVHYTHTDPYKADSDGDGLDNEDEARYGDEVQDGDEDADSQGEDEGGDQARVVLMRRGPVTVYRLG